MQLLFEVYFLFNYCEVLTIFFLFQVLTNEANELLPIFNKTSTKIYKSTIATGDWSDQHSQMGGGRHASTAFPKN